MCESPASRSLRRFPHAVCSSSGRVRPTLRRAPAFPCPDSPRASCPPGPKPWVFLRLLAGFRAFLLSPSPALLPDRVHPSCDFISPSEICRPTAARSLLPPRPPRPPPSCKHAGDFRRDRNARWNRAPLARFSGPFDATQRVRSTQGLRHPATFRPRPFPGPRRFTPRCASWPCFMPHAPVGFPPLQGFPLLGEQYRLSTAPALMTLPGHPPSTACAETPAAELVRPAPPSGPCSPREVRCSNRRFRPAGARCPPGVHPLQGLDILSPWRRLHASSSHELASEGLTVTLTPVLRSLTGREAQLVRPRTADPPGVLHLMTLAGPKPDDRLSATKRRLPVHSLRASSAKAASGTALRHDGRAGSVPTLGANVNH